jgi:hypothetical protein
MTPSAIGPLVSLVPLLILCTPLIAAAAGPAASDTPSAATSQVASSATSEAKAHFDRGVELYREGNLDAALAEFERANELSPSHHLLYNLAQVQAERHDYVHAVELLDAYLEQGGAEVPAARRAEVEQESARLRQRIAALWVSADVDAATLWVNDEAVATLPLHEPVMLNAGIARLRIEAAGRKTLIRELAVAGGDRPHLTLSLEIAPRTATALPLERDAEPASGWSPLRAVGFFTGAVGLAGIGVGSGFGISVLDQSKTARQLCDGDRCTSQRGVDAAQRAATYATIATIGVAAGGALLVTGVVLWLSGASDAGESAEPVSADVRVAPLAGSSELGMALSGKW